MNQHPVEYSNIPDADDRRGTPPPPEPAEEPEEEPEEEESGRSTDSRIVYRPDGISTKAVLASLLVMGALGTGGFLLMHSFLMHSFVRGDQPRSPEVAMAELHAVAVPGAISPPPSLIPPPPPPPSPPSFLESLTATSALIQTIAQAPAAATARPPKVLPHVHVYPFPVFAGQVATSGQGALSAHPSASSSPPPEGTSGTNNPYDEVPEATTSAARRAPIPANAVPSDDSVGSRE